ncbi:hypothetical protein BX616_009117 [Lobosporangium transversale]|nr:hypothetical protein BX616_009117 [Lobosporangium transversale]
MMMLQYQRFRLGGRVEEIEVETNPKTGQQYVLLRDVQDVFPTACRFELDGRPVKFQSDEQGHRLEPWRIACHLDSTLQVVPTRQILAPPKPESVPTPPTFQPGSSLLYASPSPLMPTGTAYTTQDWQDYLLQRIAWIAIMSISCTLTVLTNHIVSSWVRYSNMFTMVELFWRVVTVVLFLLSVAWFLILAFLLVQMIWFLTSIPISTKRSMYQRLFDF